MGSGLTSRTVISLSALASLVLQTPPRATMVHTLSPCTDGSASPCGVAVPQPVADSCNEPCVRQCPDSTVVIYPPPVVVTIPGPILSTFPQQSVVGSAGVPAVGAGLGGSAGSGAGAGAGLGGSFGSSFGAARTPGASQVCGGARWARGYPVGSCGPCC